MGELRIHTVMGRVQISLWCKSHGGPAHCLWRGQKWRGGLEAGDVLLVMREASNVIWDMYDKGELDELTDDCL